MKRITILILSTLCASCASNFHLNKHKDIITRITERDLNAKLNSYKPETAYILSNNLSKEQEILELSNVFTLSNDSTTNVKVLLKPIIEKNPFCGTPIALTLFTLGILPGFLPRQYDYEFIKIINTDTTSYKISIEGYVSISIWGWFSKPFRNENKLIAKRLKEQFVLGKTSWIIKDYLINKNH
jgi:hypothetical protein